MTIHREVSNTTDSYPLEQSVLGCLMVFPKRYAAKIPFLSAEFFADEIHRSVFNAIRRAYDKAFEKLDVNIVLSQCTSAEQKTEIIECADSAFESTPFDEHFKLLLSAAEERFVKSQIEELMLNGNYSAHKLRQIADLADEAYSDDSERKNSDVYNSYLVQIDKPRDVVLTRYPRLDGLTGGLQRGTLSIIGARPSVGKTTFALNIATNVALNGKNVAFFTLEMTANMILDKLASSNCTIPYTCFNGKLREADKKIVSDFLNTSGVKDRLAIIDDLNTIEGICSYILNSKPDVVVIDYVQIIRTLRKFDSMRLQIDYISSELKRIAKSTKCCIILLSQLKRPESGKVAPPTMSDLKESGSLEQDGDYVFLLYRPYAQCKSGGYDPENTTLQVEKNKFGESRIIKLKFNGKYQTFTEAREFQADMPI